MKAAVFLKSLTLSNILSFGPEPHTVELGPLNVIIGPNGSGKSNFIEAIGLLKAVATDVQEPIRTGGGVAEWLWKGYGGTGVAKIEATVTDPLTDDEASQTHRDSFCYRLSFSEIGQHFHLRNEDFSIITHEESPRRIPFFEVRSGRVRREDYDEKELNRTFVFDRDQSLLTQLAPPFNEQDTFDFARRIRSIPLIKEIDAGMSASARRPQKADMPNLSHPLIFINNHREQFLCRIASLNRLRRLRDCHSIKVVSGLLAKFEAQVVTNRLQMHSQVAIARLAHPGAKMRG